MKAFIYWNNQKKAHGEKIAEIHATTLLEADEIFKKEYGINPMSTWIGVEIKN